MANEKRDVLLIGPSKPAVERGLAGFTVHNLAAAKNREAFFGSIGHVRAMAVAAPVERINDPFLARLPRLQIIAMFGVGYDMVAARKPQPAQHHGDQHARCADGGGGRYGGRPAHQHGARAAAGRSLAARRTMGRDGTIR